MKTFEGLFAEIQARKLDPHPPSGTTRLLDDGIHAIGKKIVEEAAEVWMAAEHQGRDRTAEEIAQLLYFIEVLMVSADITLEDVYQRL